MSNIRKNPPSSHPYIAEIVINPVKFDWFQYLAEQSRTVKFLDVDDSKPDFWRMRFGCASQEVAKVVESNWD